MSYRLNDDEEVVSDKKRKCIVQALFCLDLMERLYYSISESDDSGYNIENHTRMQNDTIRLRRELLELGKLLGG